MREFIIIIAVSIVFVIIVYPIVLPGWPVILSVRGLSELRSYKDVELILYSDQLYKCMSAVFFARYIEKHREYYRFRYQDKVYTIPKEEVETIEFTGSWNIGWW